MGWMGRGKFGNWDRKGGFGVEEVSAVREVSVVSYRLGG
jgi:hypothetical protein